MDKKIIISSAIIGLVAAAAVSGTVAYFNDTETSEDNAFTAGTLNLEVGGNDPTDWHFEALNIKPGDTGSEEVLLQNTGSLDGYLHITFANLVNDEMGCTEPEGQPEGSDTTCDNPGEGDGELAENLDLLIYLDEDSSDNFVLGTDTLVYQGKARGILQGDEFNYFLASSSLKDFRVEWELPTLTGNEAQSDKAGFDIVFELTQTQKDIVGNWHFNEGEGLTAYDSSGRGNDGTLSSDDFWADGQYNPALGFDGNDNNVVIPDSDSLKPTFVTLEAWVKSNGSPGNHRYIAGKCYGGGWGSYHLYTGNTGGLKFYIGYDGSYVASPNVSAANIWDDNWHHITGTYDGSTVKLYVDGAEIPGGTGTTEDIAYNTEDFYIGSYGTIGYYFSGLIDEVKVYSRALSGSEISDHYNAGL
ncbi:SipW-dependent-type signal peptide-containing protein [Candidatus Parcubacteria bacterium]|nr:SipW-dependent-type signal peptide-containing protein [Candidatus Parcubacteria bacterium]